MADVRPARTYRWHRRNEWRGLNRWLGNGNEVVKWRDFNAVAPRPEYGIGAPPVTNRLFEHGRSKYMPHGGENERVRRYVQALRRKEKQPGELRSFFASLSRRQREAVLRYDGDDTVGNPDDF